MRATRRQQLLEELDAIIRTLTAIALAAPSPLLLATGEVSVVIGYMLMMTSWLTMISMALDFARTSASAFYAKRRLGAHGSGAMLPGHGPRRRVPPPTLDDWSDDLAVARTRFDVIQLRAMLHGFGLMRIDGSPKRYRVYQSGKLYSKKRPGGGFYKSSHAKYFHVQADTALILVLMYLAIPGRMCDLSQSMGATFSLPPWSIGLTSHSMGSVLTPGDSTACGSRDTTGWNMASIEVHSERMQCRLWMPVMYGPVFMTSCSSMRNSTLQEV